VWGLIRFGRRPTLDVDDLGPVKGDHTGNKAHLQDWSSIWQRPVGTSQLITPYLAIVRSPGRPLRGKNQTCTKDGLRSADDPYRTSGVRARRDQGLTKLDGISRSQGSARAKTMLLIGAQTAQRQTPLGGR
jgi:hypothetical protein